MRSKPSWTVDVHSPKPTAPQFEWLDYWLDNHIAPRRRPRTLETYQANLRLHVRDYLGDVRLDNLTTATLEHWQNDLLRRVSPIRAQAVRNTLASALKTAKRTKRIYENPLEDVEPISVPRKKASVPEIADVLVLLARAENEKALAH